MGMNSKPYKKKHGAYLRLKIASEFINKGGESRICQEYGITPPTLYTYLRMFNKDYLSFIDFYTVIMGELWENGYKGAAQHLRNNAPKIFRDNIGSPPPEDINVDFGESVPPEEKRKSNDIVNPLSILDELTGNRKG